MEPQVILVDENDREIGTARKMEAHEKALLHRAFSIFIFDSSGRLLLQKRAVDKYHSGGLWTNTCCSHPLPGRPLPDEARRKLREEMGFECELQKISHFIYKVKLENGLFEHELDHVFAGTYEGNPIPNPAEVQDWKWMNVDELREDLKQNPSQYSYWISLALEKLDVFLTRK